MLLFWCHEDVGRAMDKSSGGPQSLLLHFFWRSHPQIQSPESLGSWKIPEVGGSPPLKRESGARTPSPAARRCHCGCQPAQATGSRKNPGAPVHVGGIKAVKLQLLVTAASCKLACCESCGSWVTDYLLTNSVA